MRRADWLALTILTLLLGLVFIFAGVGPGEVSAQESGSAERPTLPFRFPDDPLPGESGSVERFNPPRFGQPAESGSIERAVPRFLPPGEPRPAESGSTEKWVPGGPIDPDSFKPRDQKTTGKTPPVARVEVKEAETGRDSPTIVTTEFPNLIVPVVVFLAGLFLVGWSLFRMGLFNPYTANLWPKRLELCIEIALRMDDFMTALHEKKFEKCQMSLDALNHLNGRRSILLSNQINAAVNRFVESAVSAKISLEDEALRNELNRRYEAVIEALRLGTRQEELSLEVLRSLTKAQGPHRRLLEKPAEEKPA